MFKAILVDNQNQSYSCNLVELENSELKSGDVEVNVLYSSINYKDALAITGKAPVVRQFPMVPGIDFVGEVSHSQHPNYSPGQKVILTGWGVGESHWGGLAQVAKVKGDWLVPLPDTLNPLTSMILGTAGFTAMLCIDALEQHGVQPSQGQVLVTGASGGVGSIAVSILSNLGYKVVGVTGRTEQTDYIKSLGARSVIHRFELEEPNKPLRKEKWAGVIDVVGSKTLAGACAETQYGGVVAACGLAGGMDFPATVAPFILRGITLVGVDSVMCPKPKRLAAWERLADQVNSINVDAVHSVISLEQAPEAAEKLLANKTQGRIIVDVNA